MKLEMVGISALFGEIFSKCTNKNEYTNFDTKLMDTMVLENEFESVVSRCEWS